MGCAQRRGKPASGSGGICERLLPACLAPQAAVSAAPRGAGGGAPARAVHGATRMDGGTAAPRPQAQAGQLLPRLWDGVATAPSAMGWGGGGPGTGALRRGGPWGGRGGALCRCGRCLQAGPHHTGARGPGAGARSRGAWVPAQRWCKDPGNGVGDSGGEARGGWELCGNRLWELGGLRGGAGAGAASGSPGVGGHPAACPVRLAKPQDQAWKPEWQRSHGIPRAAGCAGSSAGAGARRAGASWGEAGAEAKRGEGGELRSRQPSRGMPAWGLLGLGGWQGFLAWEPSTAAGLALPELPGRETAGKVLCAVARAVSGWEGRVCRCFRAPATSCKHIPGREGAAGACRPPPCFPSLQGRRNLASVPAPAARGQAASGLDLAVPCRDEPSGTRLPRSHRWWGDGGQRGSVQCESGAACARRYTCTGLTLRVCTHAGLGVCGVRVHSGVWAYLRVTVCVLGHACACACAGVIECVHVCAC